MSSNRAMYKPVRLALSAVAVVLAAPLVLAVAGFAWFRTTEADLANASDLSLELAGPIVDLGPVARLALFTR